MQLSHCCSLSHYPKSPSAPGVREVCQKKERKKLKVTAFPQHSCDALALVKGHVVWRIPNIFCLILKLPGFPCLIAAMFCSF